MSVAPVRMAAADRRRHLIETAITRLHRGQLPRDDDGGDRAGGAACPSRSSTGTSRRSASSTSPPSTTSGSKAKAKWEELLLGSPSVAGGFEDMGRGHFSVRDCKFQLAEMWVQALGEAADDPELRKHLRRHMREVHDFLADAIRRGQEDGSLHPDRDPEAEAWVFRVSARPALSRHGRPPRRACLRRRSR